jgi:hypothetical protein
VIARLASRLSFSRGSAIWVKVGVVGFVVFVIAAVTGYWFGTVDELVYFSDTGRSLDCGTALAPSRSAGALAYCGDSTRGDLIGLVLMSIVAAAAVATMVVATIRQRR